MSKFVLPSNCLFALPSFTYVCIFFLCVRFQYFAVLTVIFRLFFNSCGSCLRHGLLLFEHCFSWRFSCCRVSFLFIRILSFFFGVKMAICLTLLLVTFLLCSWCCFRLLHCFLLKRFIVVCATFSVYFFLRGAVFGYSLLDFGAHLCRGFEWRRHTRIYW